MKVLTLCIPQKGHKILLGMKKAGFGAGRWNGFGGKVEAGETIEDATKRELKEEAGLIAAHIDKVGRILFEFEDGTGSREVHIFSCSSFKGEPVETEEMKPQWFDAENLPLEGMWPADKIWLPYFLAGKRFGGNVLYDHPSTSDFASSIMRNAIVVE